MKKSFRLFCAFISILSFFTFSCQHELLPSPKNETTTDQNQNQETVILFEHRDFRGKNDEIKVQICRKIRGKKFTTQ